MPAHGWDIGASSTIHPWQNMFRDINPISHGLKRGFPMDFSGFPTKCHLGPQVKALWEGRDPRNDELLDLAEAAALECDGYDNVILAIVAVTVVINIWGTL